jgi:serine/threonine-protein kinase HipA
MHLKNFSLMRSIEGSVALAPAYDLVATKIVIPDDPEEAALTINGKKRNLRRTDFEAMARTLGIAGRVVESSLAKFSDNYKDAMQLINKSFLKEAQRETYASLFTARARRLGVLVL